MISRRITIALLAVGLLLVALLSLAAQPANKPTKPPGSKSTNTNAANATPGSEKPIDAAGQRTPAERLVDLGYEGVSTCTAANCHNGPRRAGQPAWPSSYKVWIADDHHSRAYQTLFSDRSKKIAELLGPDRLGAADAHQSIRCLVCHSMQPLDEKELLPDSILADGIGCEVCHGPASKWRNIHYLKDKAPIGQTAWSKLSAQEKEEKLGFRNLSDVLTRATTCVDCHVGAPGRQVDHELIAAGHPRLAFEFAALHGRIPKHWDVRGEEATGPFAARCWSVGQAAGLQAALKLLADRADNAQPAETTRQPARPWPEFAEYDCFACHHELVEKSWRRDKPHIKTLGLPAWGTWQMPLAAALARQSQPALGVDAAQLESALKALDATMQNSWPAADHPSIVSQAQTAAAAAGAWATALDRSAKHDPAAIKKLLVWAVSDADHLSENWDTAAQLYLALDALSEAQQRGSTASTTAASTSTKSLAQIRALLKKLEFPPPYTSPKNFCPQEFRDELTKIRDLLNEK